MSNNAVTATHKEINESDKSEILPHIVARAKAGDEDAYQLIFSRYGRPVIGFINNLVGSRDLAEDLTQETFVRAFKSIRGLNDNLKLSTWIFGIARNVVRESIRRSIKDRNRISLDESDSDLLKSEKLKSDGLTQEGKILNGELNGKIGNALMMLDNDKRLAFVLKIFHEKSYEEMSSITGHSIGKLKTDLHRARAEMRKSLASYFGSTK